MSAETKKIYGILAEFNNPRELIDVSKKVVELGYDKYET
jgi:replicative DNA helicase